MFNKIGKIYLVRMKKIILVLLLIQPVFASEWDIYFKEGNKAYSNGKYEDAIMHYSKILENGVASGELYYNLGNAYYKLDEIGKSIYYYEKAKLYIEGDEALEQNLSIARLKIVDEIEPIPRLFIWDWVDNIMQILSIEHWGWVTLMLFIAMAIMFSLYMLYTKKMLFRLSWIFLIFFSITLVFFVAKIYIFESNKFGIIFDNKIDVMSEPNLGAAELFILHEGTKVKINRILNDWYEISIADGKTGWCKANSIGVI
jgi:tetratricopeptide (TPR) repeat protein